MFLSMKEKNENVSLRPWLKMFSFSLLATCSCVTSPCMPLAIGACRGSHPTFLVLGLRSVWQAPLSVAVEILLSQLCSCNDSFWLSSSGGVAWALSFLTVLLFYSESQMSQGQDRSSLRSKGTGLELRRWVATTAAPEKDKNTKCHHNLFVIRGSRMPLQCWEDCGLAASPHLNPAHTCQPREADVVRDDFALSSEGAARLLCGQQGGQWLTEPTDICMIRENQQSHLKDWSSLMY